MVTLLQNIRTRLNMSGYLSESLLEPRLHIVGVGLELVQSYRLLQTLLSQTRCLVRSKKERERMKEMERNKERTEEEIIRTDSEFIDLLTKTFKFIHKSTYSSSPPPVAPTEL